MAGSRLTRRDIVRLFDLLNAELAAGGTVGELYVVGGAVMCLALGAREATKDVDALFVPTRTIREAAARVKGFLSPRGTFDRFLDLRHLRVFVAQPAHLLAMKCAALRLGEEFHDLDDVRYLLRHLDIHSADEALAVLTQYFDAQQLLSKTRLILESLFDQR